MVEVKRTCISQIPLEEDKSGWSLKGSRATPKCTQTNYRVFWWRLKDGLEGEVRLSGEQMVEKVVSKEGTA